MSVDLHWETLTSGAEGDIRAEKIREFIHDKFQLVPFPKFIKSVQVHSFSFGTIAPDIEIKTICDPYPEFYEQDEEDGSETDSADDHDEQYLLKLERERRRKERKNEDRESVHTGTSSQPPPYSAEEATPRRPSGGGLPSFRAGIADTFPGRVGVTGVATPLFNPLPSASSASNLHYFHSALSPGFNNGNSSPALSVFQQSAVSTPSKSQNLTEPSNNSFPSPPSPADPGHSPVPHLSDVTPKSVDNTATSTPERTFGENESLPRQLPRLREPRDEDTQIIARVRYAGDVRVEITCELLFEYPVTNFVALPVKLVITGCTFDGLACVAYIRRRAHFCFLDEDPEAREPTSISGGTESIGQSLLKQIHVDSEIGEKGKQVLKNVGKVERFVLEQVRRIFEEEFVFPSSWTFLV
jgi:distribution and morphology protein 12